MLHTPSTKSVLFFCLLSIFVWVVSSTVQASTLTVTKTADTNDGACNADCSLREAITAAAASDIINFNIPSATDAGCVAETGVCTISPTAIFPNITDAGLTINGYSQTGASANTNDFPSAINAVIKIVINGASAGAGADAFTINNVANVTIQGLAITGFLDYGIIITGMGATNAKIQGCFIGTDATGEIDSGNTSSGIYVLISAAQAIIGTDGNGINDAAERNLISGNNAHGVYLNSGTLNRVAGNFIGTDKDGTTDLGNAGNGILIAAGTSTDILGTNGDGVYDAGEGNLIAGNDVNGIGINSGGHVIAGNRIGVQANGTATLRNGVSGIVINAGDNTRVGTNGDGTGDTEERNIISGHTTDPNRAIFGVSNGIIIAGNYIGLDVTGTVALSNNRGIQASTGSQSWRIGTNGDGINDEAERNVISGNIYNLFIEGTNHVIAGNTIGTNATGNANVGGNSYGVRVYAGTGHRIGTNADGVSDSLERNIISGQSSAAISIEAAVSNVTVSGNYLGTDSTGMTSISNAAGVALGFWNGTGLPTTNNRIGTDSNNVNDEVERNVISGNTYGVVFSNGNNNTVAGNYIGVASDGTTSLPNLHTGVLFAYSGGANNVIGGNTAASANIIANNGDAAAEYGVRLFFSTSDNNHILRNIFYNNFDKGIKLSGDGSNNDIPAPTLTQQVESGVLKLTGTARPDETVQLYLADTAHQEGQTYIADIISDGDGAWSYTLLANKAAGNWFVATATDATDGTSEFSSGYELQNELPLISAQTVAGTEEIDLTVTLPEATDANGDALTYKISTLPTNGTLYQTPDGVTRGSAITTALTTITDTNRRVILSPAPNLSGNGSCNFGYVAFDGLDNSLEATATVNLADVEEPPTQNTAPVVSVGSDRDAVAGATIRLNATATDVDGDPLTYAWSSSASSSVSFVNAAAANTQAALSESLANSIITVTLTVNDGQATASDSLSLRIFSRDIFSQMAQTLESAIVASNASGEYIVQDDQAHVGNRGTFSLTFWDDCSVYATTSETATVLVVDENHIAVGDPYSQNNTGLVALFHAEEINCPQTIDLDDEDLAQIAGVSLVRGNQEESFFGKTLKLGDLDGNGINEIYATASGNAFGFVYGLNVDSLTVVRIFIGAESQQIKSQLIELGNLDSNAGTEFFTGTTAILTAETFDGFAADQDFPALIDLLTATVDLDIDFDLDISHLLDADLNNDGAQDFIFGAKDSNQIEILFGSTETTVEEINLETLPITCDEEVAFETVEVGDITGDDANDLILGFPSANDGAGRILIVPGPFFEDSESEDTSGAFVIDGATDEQLGRTLLVADYNGDGVDDLFSQIINSEGKTNTKVFALSSGLEDGNGGSNDQAEELGPGGCGCMLGTTTAPTTFWLLWLILFPVGWVFLRRSRSTVSG